jgi:hypothetical protein
MKKIEKIKKEKGLQTSDLPKDIQQEIVGLQNLINKYNEACDTYEKLDEINEKTEAQLDDLEDEIAEVEDSIVEKINVSFPKVETEAKVQVEEKKEKSESSSIGWLVFGGAALVLTLGAVNVFKNK